MIVGKFYYKHKSTARPAQISMLGDFVQVELLDGSNKIFHYQYQECEFSQRVSHINRRITFANEDIFQTDDNVAIDTLLQARPQQNNSKLASLISSFELNPIYIFGALFLSIGFVFLIYFQGIPFVSKQVAHGLPLSVSQQISKGSFAELDKRLFKPSAISLEQQQKIEAHFKQKLLPLLDVWILDHRFSLHFRKLERGYAIPNAFALPSGDIVITDKLVELATNQQELDSIILHEIGHIVERHGLQKVISSSLSFLITSLILGNDMLVGDLVAGFGGWLLSGRYSVNSEREADDFAFNKMIAIDIDPTSYITMMNRIEQYHQLLLSCESEISVNQQGHLSCKKQSTFTASEKETSVWENFLATHPSTDERLARARLFAQCYQDLAIACPD